MQKFVRWSGWLLLVGAGTTVGLWAALFVLRAREQQQAVAALRELEILGYYCALPAEGGMGGGAGFVSSKVASPVEFAPHGPGWLRSKLGEEWCRNWIDTPVAVNLAGSEANDADFARISSFPLLKKLDLVGTKGTGKGISIVRHLSALEELQFGWENLSDSDLACLEHLKSLRVLMLWGQIGDAGIETVSQLSTLTNLTVSSSAITDEGLRSLSRMENLERLSLSWATITDSGVDELSRLPRLKSLYLGGIPGISEECLDRLRKAHPGLSVKYQRVLPEA